MTNKSKATHGSDGEDSDGDNPTSTHPVQPHQLQVNQAAKVTRIQMTIPRQPHQVLQPVIVTQTLMMMRRQYMYGTLIRGITKMFESTEEWV